MRLSGRAELWVDAKVKSKRTATKPDSATLLQIYGFRLFDQAKNPRVEGSCDILLTRWHGQLNVIETDNLAHVASFRQPNRRRLSRGVSSPESWQWRPPTAPNRLLDGEGVDKAPSAVEEPVRELYHSAVRDRDRTLR